jgi:2-polyprenyl-6-methoxyphenol hydroxylase-like FAD-dependent oxidoreductase
VASVAYDIITVGGGLGGAALAKAMAEKGYRVLVLERETQFKDRVRGEWMAPWGVADAFDLGLRDTMLANGGHELANWDTYFGGMNAGRREFVSTTPQQLPAMTFYHPQMQEAVIASAEESGAEVRRGARVRGAEGGAEPRVDVEWDGRSEKLSAGLIVGADGRGSPVRKWAGFAAREDPARMLLSGLLFEDVTAAQDAAIIVINPFLKQGALSFPQGNGRTRCYFGCRVDAGVRLQGEKDVPRFIAEAVQTGLPAALFEGARPNGPLATFSGADEWTDHPYREGMALVGDAAATSDPTWGQGLSLTMRDVRTLRDKLLEDDDWERAGHAYAEEHDRYYNAVHPAEDWLTQLFMEQGPDADARRMRVMPLIVQDPSRVPDTFFSGPEASPVDDAAKRRFFGEE